MFHVAPQVYHYNTTYYDVISPLYYMCNTRSSVLHVENTAPPPSSSLRGYSPLPPKITGTAQAAATTASPPAMSAIAARRPSLRGEEEEEAVTTAGVVEDMGVVGEGGDVEEAAVAGGTVIGERASQ